MLITVSNPRNFVFRKSKAVQLCHKTDNMSMAVQCALPRSHVTVILGHVMYRMTGH